MSNVRVLNGTVELNYEPVAKFLVPEYRFAEIEDALVHGRDHRGGYEEGLDDGYDEGFEAGKDKGIEDGRQEMDDEFTAAIERAVEGKIFTQAQVDKFIEEGLWPNP